MTSTRSTSEPVTSCVHVLRLSVVETGGVDPELKSATERWFIRRGLPHVIDDYSATEDVFTRAVPFLSVVFFLEVFASFDDRFDGWGQFGVFVAAIAILTAAVLAVNRIRGRSPFQLPDEIGIPELSVFVFIPALLPVLFSDERWWRFIAVVGLNVIILVGSYLVTSYGLVPMIRFGAEQMLKRVGQIGHLMARTLPLLLLFTAFVFLNAEVWQVASDFTPAYYAIVVALLVLVGVGFLLLRAPKEVANLEQFETWDEVVRLVGATDAPLVDTTRSVDGRPDITPLGRADRANVTLLVVMSQLVQVILVALVIGLFYVVFGLLAVRGATIGQWTTAEVDPLTTFDFLGSNIVLTWEHLGVAGFIAAFSALQFAVSMVTDSTYRDEFYEDITGEIREVLAVRAVYLDRLSA